jgi:L-seryl-tRNA(Ser) seleniumtransferase
LLSVAGLGGDAGGLEQALRRGEPPVIARLQEGQLLLDLRTVLPSQDDVLADRVAELFTR